MVHLSKTKQQPVGFFSPRIFNHSIVALLITVVFGAGIYYTITNFYSLQESPVFVYPPHYTPPPKPNNFKLLSPTSGSVFSTNSVKIGATTDTESVSVVLGCSQKSEIVEKTDSLLEINCRLKPGVNSINIVNIDRNFKRFETQLNLLQTGKTELFPTNSSNTVVGKIKSINDKVVTLTNGLDEIKIPTDKNTKFLTENFISSKLENLRIDDKVMIFPPNDSLKVNALVVLQFPLNYNLTKPFVLYSTFKEIIKENLILPNLEDKTAQPWQLKLNPEAKAFNQENQNIDLKSIEFSTKLVAVGVYDDYGNPRINSIHLLDNWK